MRNHEITTEQKLLDNKGQITEPGWSRKQVLQYRRKDIKAPRFRIKEWDYYLVLTNEFAAAFTISDDGYLGLQSVSLLLFGDKPTQHTETILSAFPMGKLHMPETSSKGDVSFHNKRLKMDFKLENGYRHITCEFKKFWNDKTFICDIRLKQPEMDSMVIATPWDKKHHFYYNQKVNCMRAEGYVEYDGKKYSYNPATDFGTLDWGRGVWTYSNSWLWGTGNCDINGKAFGFNIGYGFGNTKAASENVIFYDGKVHKLDDITFNIPKDDYMKPWTYTSSDGRFEMDFIPILDRAAKIDIKLICSDQHQVYGRMSGKAILDDGTVIDIKDVLCSAEIVRNRY